MDKSSAEIPMKNIIFESLNDTLTIRRSLCGFFVQFKFLNVHSNLKKIFSRFLSGLPLILAIDKFYSLIKKNIFF